MKLLLPKLLAVSLFLVFSIMSYGQDKPRTVEKFTSANEPIELVILGINDRQFALNQQVPAGKTWLRDLKPDSKKHFA